MKVRHLTRPALGALAAGLLLSAPVNEAVAQTGAKYSPARTKALSEWADTLALQAASWGAPAVVMYNLRWNDAVGPKPKAAPNQIFRMEVISTPGEAEASGYVSPN
jgi:hypothetical protein